MSLARIEHVTHARKDQGKCEKDGTPIEKGDPYIWFSVGFRSRWKHVRCLNSSCYPRDSERESSAVSSVMGAIESASDNIAGSTADNQEDFEQEVRDGLQEIVDAFEEVIETYREADQNFGGGGSSQHGERADELEEAKDAIDTYWSYNGGEPEPCEEHEDESEPQDGCDQCAIKFAEWLDGAKSDAQSALDEISF